MDGLEGLTKAENDAVREELRYRVMQQMLIAKEEQAQAAKELSNNPLAHSEYGTQKMQIHPFFIAYWNERLPGCWDDEEFVAEFLRDNDLVRVQCKSRKTTVSFAGIDLRKIGAKALEASSAGLGKIGSVAGELVGVNGQALNPKEKQPIAEAI